MLYLNMRAILTQNILLAQVLFSYFFQWLESHDIKKHSVVTGFEPTTSSLLDQRRSRSDNQATPQHLLIHLWI